MKEIRKDIEFRAEEVTVPSTDILLIMYRNARTWVDVYYEVKIKRTKIHSGMVGKKLSRIAIEKKKRRDVYVDVGEIRWLG